MYLANGEERDERREQGDRKHLILPPDVEVKGDVRFDLQLVSLCRLKYTVVCTIIVPEQLTVQKPENIGDSYTCNVLQNVSDKQGTVDLELVMKQ